MYPIIYLSEDIRVACSGRGMTEEKARRCSCSKEGEREWYRHQTKVYYAKKYHVKVLKGIEPKYCKERSTNGFGNLTRERKTPGMCTGECEHHMKLIKLLL